jgi:hypothetical protein
MKSVVTIPKIVLLVVTIVTLTLFVSIYPIKVSWKPVFASPDTITLRPNAAGTYQTWATFGTGTAHWDRTSDQNVATGVQVTGLTTSKETENLVDTTQTGTINSVTAYMRAKSTAGGYIQVTYQVAGTGSGTTGNPTPAYPSGLVANDLILLQVTVRDTSNTPSTPTGFTPLYSAESSTVARQWIYYKFSTGSESGTITITIGGTSCKVARMYSFRNVALSSFTEGGGFGYSASSTTMSAQSVTTTGINELDVSFNFVTYNTAVASFTGETGGDWIEAVAEFTTTAGSRGCVQLQTATMASAGTISGGTLSLGSTARSWGVRAFALKPIDPYEQGVILWRIYSTDYESSAITISRTAFTDYSQTRTINPNTGVTWTWTEVNALEIGSRASTLASGETIQVSEYWIVVEYTPNQPPSNGSPSYHGWDDTNNCYAQRQWYEVDVVYTDTDGFADFDYVELRIMQGASTRAIFRYDEDTNTATIELGSTQWDFNTSGTFTESGNTITCHWQFKPQWDATEEANVEVQLYCCDGAPSSDTDTYNDVFDVVTRLVTDGFTNDDSRINVGGTTTISGTVYYGNDPSSNVASTFYPPDAEFTSVSIHNSAHASQATDNTIVNGAFSVNFAIPSAVQSNTYHVYIDMADADYTDADAVDSDTTSVIGDRIEIYSQTLDDSRVNINTNIEFRVQARLDFDDHALGSEDSLTANAGSMVWDSANGWFDAQRSQGTVGSYTFQLSSGSEVTYGITSIYVGVSNPTGVWDRIKVYWEQLNDSRVDIGSAIEGRYKAVLDYDDHPLGSGDSLSVSWGSLTWDSENGWWNISHSESVVTGITITGWSGNEVTYGITSITENITETTYIYDRIEIYEKDDPIIVNEFWQTQNRDQQVIPTHMLFYPLLVCTVFPFLGIKNKKKAKAFTFILLLSFLVVIVPNININTVFASDETVTVNTCVIIWFRARYDYDKVTYSDSGGSTLSINATSATYNSTAGALYWYRNVTQSTPGEYVYTVTAISDGVYGLTTFNNIIGYITITFTDPPPTYSNVGTNSTFAGQPCEFYTLWNDNTNVSGFIFGTNNTGSWENDTWVAFSAFYNSTAAWSNVTKTLNSTIGVVIQWQIWCNDTGNNWNNTGIQTFATTLAYKLNLRVMDWDLTDAIANAYVTMNNETDHVQVSDSNGWANYTGLSGTVTVKVQYFGFWVNGTFSVTMDSDKTIDVRCKLYDVTVLVQEGVQNAYLAGANVTVYNSTSVQSNKITSGVTGNNGQVQLLNLPNNTLTFTQYGGASYSLVIGNTTRLVSSENQPITLTADKNNINTNNSYSIIAFVGMAIPFKSSFVTKRLKRKIHKRKKKRNK